MANDYTLLYLEQAKNDIKEIVLYVSEKLKNPTAAEKLLIKLVETAERARQFPYSNPTYFPLKPLKYEYRRVTVDSYMLFYRVDEESGTVTVARVVYSRRNLSAQMKK